MTDSTLDSENAKLLTLARREDESRLIHWLESTDPRVGELLALALAIIREPPPGPP